MAEVVLGIDVGTSGVRVAASDRSGALVAMASASIAAPLQNFGRLLQDPNLWWQAIEQCFQSLDLKAQRVLALAIDGTSGTILPVAETGEPLGLASMYNDVAEADAVEAVKRVAPADTAALGSSSPLARALGLPASAPCILHQADWLMGRFTGRFDTSDENNALKTGYDPVSRSWPAWISATGLDARRLPHVVAAGEAVGKIQAAVAQRLGLPDDVMIVAGTTDGCAAFLASGASQAGDGVTSLGTTLTLKVLSATPVFAPQYGIYSHRIGDTWLAGGASNTGGGVLKTFFSGEDMARLTPLLDPAVPVGLGYYPLSKPGERFPIADPALVPKVTPRPVDERQFFQALLEGIADVETLGYRRLAELGASPLISIRSVGGGAANAAWTTIRLKALGVPALSPLSEHAAMGTARLAWRGIGHAA